MSIQVRHVTKRFSATPVLDDVSVDIAAGELVALLGPSGCGKTTLLRIIAGLEQPDAGAILFSGEDITDVDVRRRGVGFVFQHYALFRHMTVADNVAFGLRVKPRGERPSEAAIRRTVKDLLALVQLEGMADRYPSQLSGGQRQRIALARALAVEPKVLLLDEPFGALDAQVRKELRRWLRRLHDELHVASVFVTHDQEEALEVADRVVVMHAGKIEQVGTPDEVWQRPATPFVQGFLGDVNLFRGRADGGVLDLEGVRLDAPEHGQARDVAALAYVRPHELDVARPGELPGGGLRVRLSRVVQAGALARLHLDREGSGQPLEADVPAEWLAARAWRTGETLEVRPRRARVFLQP